MLLRSASGEEIAVQSSLLLQIEAWSREAVNNLWLIDCIFYRSTPSPHAGCKRKVTGVCPAAHASHVPLHLLSVGQYWLTDSLWSGKLLWRLALSGTLCRAICTHCFYRQSCTTSSFHGLRALIVHSEVYLLHASKEFANESVLAARQIAKNDAW